MTGDMLLITSVGSYAQTETYLLFWWSEVPAVKAPIYYYLILVLRCRQTTVFLKN